MTNLLTISLLGSVMILVIVCLRALFQNRVHRTVFLLLWLLAAVRLGVPAVFSSSASIYNFIPQGDYSWHTFAQPDADREETMDAESIAGFADPEQPAGETAQPIIGTESSLQIGEGNMLSPNVAAVETPGVSDGESSLFIHPVESGSENQVALSGAIATEGNPVAVNHKRAMDTGKLFMILWAVGCGCCFMYFLWIHIRARRTYRFALPEKGPDFLGNVGLKRYDGISSPLVYGFFRPVILLPVDFPKKDSPEYEQVLWHELTHVRSGDLWYKLIMLVITCVHWFNPLVWLMLFLSTQDLEIRCDARVIRKLGKKKTYAMTLVQAEVRQDHHFAEAAFAFSLTELRLKAIAKTKAYLPRSIALFSVVAVILVCCFAAGPSAKALVEPMESATAEKLSADDVTAQTLPLDEDRTESLSTEGTAGDPAISLDPSATSDADGVREEKNPYSLSIDKENELAYLLNCGYEPLDSVIEVSVKEGQSKTLALNLPEYAIFALASDGKELLSLTADYSYDEQLCYLNIVGLKEGNTVIHVSLGGQNWMRICVEILFDLYYRVPDWQNFEPYGSVRTMELRSGPQYAKSVLLKLPERATYTYSVTCDGESVSYRALSVLDWYISDTGSLGMQISAGNMDGEAVFYFYIDGILWCQLRVRIEYRSPYGNQPSWIGLYPDRENNVDLNATYGHLSQMQIEPQPIIPSYSGTGGWNMDSVDLWTSMNVGGTP